MSMRATAFRASARLISGCRVAHELPHPPRSRFPHYLSKHSFHSTPHRSKWRKNDQPSAPAETKETKETQSEGSAINENIKHKLVKLVDENNRLGPPTTVAELVQNLPRNSKNMVTHFIQFVTKLDDGEHGGATAIVRQVDRAARVKQQRDAKRAAKVQARKNAHKEVQLSWSSTDVDVEHKMKHAEETLGKGMSVTVIFAPKPGQSAPRRDDMQVRLDAVVARLQAVGKEQKAREFSRGMGAVFLKSTLEDDEIMNMISKHPQEGEQFRPSTKPTRKDKE